MSPVGIESAPLRVAVIGSGPSGFYAAEHLLKQKEFIVEVDMFERLPSPFGLVRGGVAPDHQKIKSVTKVYDRIAQHERFRFFGNVTFGKDISRADLQNHYHAVIYAVGSASDKKLNIAGEDLLGSHPATEFVGWYNAHPDYRHLEFDLSVEAVAVVGVGNVAMDVTRILARTQTELAETDIATYAQEALAKSIIKRIYVLGRRGAAQAAFTNPEIKELGEMLGADLIIEPNEVEIDDASQAYLTSENVDKKDVRNVEIMREYSKRPITGKAKQIILRFCTSPIEIIGTERVEGLKIVKNELYLDDKGEVKARATNQTEILPVGLVFRSVGYYGNPLPDVPFYERWGVIPNKEGRVLEAHPDGEQVIGDYVVGWIKRGPSGIIGTNKPDSIESAERLLEDAKAGKYWQANSPHRESIEALLEEREIHIVTYADWQIIDQLEIARGQAEGRPRRKFTEVEAMLEALADYKQKITQ